MRQNVYQRAIDAGLCPDCGEKAAPGVKRCQSCREIKNSREIGYRQANGTTAQRRATSGLCIRCGADPLFPENNYCLKCLERISGENRKRVYGISPEQFDAMINEQDGRCAICKFEFHGETKRTVPHVDHNHETGQIRALLCGWCNTGLGSFRENPSRLLDAAVYLQHFETEGR